MKQSLNISNMLLWSDAWMQDASCVYEQATKSSNNAFIEVIDAIMDFCIHDMMAAKIMEKRPIVKFIPRRKLTNQLLMCCWFGEML